MIDEMMGRLGETAGLLAGDQAGETIIPSGPGEVNPTIPLVMAVPSPEVDQGVDNEFRSPRVIGESD